MRWIYLALIIVFGAAVLIFLLQNREMVSVSFLGFGVRAPLALVVAAVYAIGGVTGGALFALLRRSYEGSQLRSPAGNAPPSAV